MNHATLYDESRQQGVPSNGKSPLEAGRFRFIALPPLQECRLGPVCLISSDPTKWLSLALRPCVMAHPRMRAAACACTAARPPAFPGSMNWQLTDQLWSLWFDKFTSSQPLISTGQSTPSVIDDWQLLHCIIIKFYVSAVRRLAGIVNESLSWRIGSSIYTDTALEVNVDASSCVRDYLSPFAVNKSGTRSTNLSTHHNQSVI